MESIKISFLIKICTDQFQCYLGVTYSYLVFLVWFSIYHIVNENQAITVYRTTADEEGRGVSIKYVLGY